MPEYIKDGALWPKLIEKAYAVYRKEGYENEDTDGQTLTAGREYSVMFAITGKEARYTAASNPSKEKFRPENIMASIKRKLEKSKSLTCGFSEKFKINDMKSEEEIEIYAEHGYAIVGIDESKKYIRLINPWKSEGRKETNSPKSQEGGHIAMSFDDFTKHFMRVCYTTNK